MSKRIRDYTDFKNFVRRNSGLTRTQIYNQYKKRGGHIGKGKALEIIRDMWDIKKGEFIRKPSIVKKDTGKKKRNNLIKFDKKKDTDHRSLKSPAVRELKKNIEKLYGTDSTKFIQIRVEIANDGYTQETQYSIFVPYNDNLKIGVKNLGQAIIDNLKIYYKNLAKRYSSLAELRDEMGESIELLQKEFSKTRNLDRQGLIDLFSNYGIEIEKISLFEFTNLNYMV